MPRSVQSDSGNTGEEHAERQGKKKRRAEARRSMSHEIEGELHDLEIALLVRGP